jgi:hypothetical protein
MGVYVFAAMKPKKVSRERVQITLHGNVLARATAAAEAKGLSLSSYLEELAKEDLRYPKPSAYDPVVLAEPLLSQDAEQKKKKA